MTNSTTNYQVTNDDGVRSTASIVFGPRASKFGSAIQISVAAADSEGGWTNSIGSRLNERRASEQGASPLAGAQLRHYDQFGWKTGKDKTVWIVPRAAHIHLRFCFQRLVSDREFRSVLALYCCVMTVYTSSANTDPESVELLDALERAYMCIIARSSHATTP